MPRCTPLQNRIAKVRKEHEEHARQQQQAHANQGSPATLYPLVMTAEDIDIPFGASVEICAHNAERSGRAVRCDVTVGAIETETSVTFRIWHNGSNALAKVVSEKGTHEIPMTETPFREGDVISVCVECDEACSLAGMVITFLCKGN